jgi:hypothetical protein
MRFRLIAPVALVLGTVALNTAQASGDDTCYPNWSPLKRGLDVCNNFPFLSPGNDTRVNLRLLLADSNVLAMAPNPVSEDAASVGYGPVPFDVSRLQAADDEQTPSDDSSTASLMALLQALGIERDNLETAGEAFLQGEGSRCRSNTDDSALAFTQQVIDTPELAQEERRALVQARLALLQACSWDAQQQDKVVPSDLHTPQAQAFASYLQAASDFYSGRFNEAQAGFANLSTAPQPWLKETATYMVVRTRLNAAQADAFDEYGSLKAPVNPAPYMTVAQALNDYLTAYPEGRYAPSARGLLRRVHWLSGEKAALAADYGWQLTVAKGAQRSVPLEALIQEIDNKLLVSAGDTLPTPLLTAVNDLMLMRSDGGPQLTHAQLMAHKAVLDQQAGLFDYLQAAFAFYLDNAPAEALKLLPAQVPAQLDYLAFSQHTLRAMALEAGGDYPTAQALWLQLLPVVTQPLQREHLELALAMNYERSGQLAQVFATASPITSAQVRLILLDKVADAALLRQQAAQGVSTREKATAYFALLYKDLMRGQYTDFASDLGALPQGLADETLDSSLGYAYGPGQSLHLFQWDGGKAEPGYRCTDLKDIAATLQGNAQDPKGLNCLGEFVRLNGLDGMPLDQRPEADQLGGTEPGFKGQVFSRLDGYQTVIGDATADRDDKAYALYRAINCYGPSGYNGCGGTEVEQPVRKAWFKKLKGTYGSTPWGKSQQYYW